MDKVKLRKMTENVILLLFLIATFLIMTHHELWRDEAQQWLLIKNLGIRDLFLQLHNEGHPFLWYFLLKGYNLLGLPYQGIGFISWALTALSAFLIVKKYDFYLLTKVVILGSVTFSYICPAICRSYSLLLLEIVTLGVIYKKRYSMPIRYNLLLGAIANTHVLALGIPGALLLIELYEVFIEKVKLNRKNQLCGIAILIVSLIILVLQLSNPMYGVAMPYNGIKEIIIQLFYNFSEIISMTTSNAILENLVLIILFYLFIYLCIKKQYKALFIVGISILFQLFVHTFVYNMSFYMASIFYMIVILGYGALSSDIPKKFVQIALIIVFACTLYDSWGFIKFDFFNKYTTSFEVAKYLKENVDSKETIYCDYPAACSSIEPYIDNPFADASKMNIEKFTYVDWQNRRNGQHLTDTLLDNVKTHGGKYLVINYYQDLVKHCNPNKYRIIYTSKDNPATDEKYMVIELT